MSDEATLQDRVAALRKQTRWAWGKLGCRCIFNDQDEQAHQDDHCPVHGTYGDPLWQLDLMTQRAEQAERELDVAQVKAALADEAVLIVNDPNPSPDDCVAWVRRYQALESEPKP